MGSLFDDLDSISSQGEKREEIIKAPFGYPGGKSRSIKYIMHHLPMRRAWVDVFGGSGIVTLNRVPSKLDVYNDRFSGVTSFYRCMREVVLFNKLCTWLDNTIHSREDFVFCRDTWEDVSDPVERAGRWFVMVTYSFGKLGRNWGRGTVGTTSLSGVLRNKIRELNVIHQRFRNVQVENSGWERILDDYDASDTVFYLDPPYVDASAGIYKHEMTHAEHRDMIDKVFSLKGFVAVSGYDNPLYNNQKWDKKIEWEVFCSMKSLAYTEENHKDSTYQSNDTGRGHVKECLWIKESK